MFDKVGIVHVFDFSISLTQDIHLIFFCLFHQRRISFLVRLENSQFDSGRENVVETESIHPHELIHNFH